ncbi:MAG: hypothetical protein AAF160_08905 [Pseudomonadota bacterium]
MGRLFFAAALATALHIQSLADVINVNFVETPFGVDASGSGSFDTTGLSLDFVDFDASTLIFVNPLDGGFGLGDAGNGDAYRIAATVPFGTQGSTTTAPGTGDLFGIAFSGGPLVMVPTGYVSQSPLSFAAAFPGESFASLGITAIGTVPITAGQNTINLNFSVAQAEIPVPPAIALLGGALLAFGAVSRRRRLPA